MLIRLTVNIIHSGKRDEFYASAHFEAEIPVAPIVGMMIEQTAWKSPRAVQTVTLCLPSNDPPYVSVAMEEIRMGGLAECERETRVHEDHGWRINAPTRHQTSLKFHA